MEPAAVGQITQLLGELRGGDRSAEARLAPLVYPELRRIAGNYVRKERPGHTLQPTALVHEAYLKLVGREKDWQNRSQFYGVASALMRCILVDYARSRNAQKRGGGLQVELEKNQPGLPDKQESIELLALDEALSRLSKLDERQCRIVEMRFFGGMTEREIADAMGLSERTVKRDWVLARAWLHAELSR